MIGSSERGFLVQFVRSMFIKSRLGRNMQSYPKNIKNSARRNMLLHSNFKKPQHWLMLALEEISSITLFSDFIAHSAMCNFRTKDHHHPILFNSWPVEYVKLSNRGICLWWWNKQRHICLSWDHHQLQLHWNKATHT